MNTFFKPMNFITNLKYMGMGMLGIFIVIAIIILSVYILSAFKKNK